MSAQLSCGNLRAVTDPESDTKFSGTIALHGVVSGALMLSVHPRAQQGSDNPNYEVFLKEPNQPVCAIGAAWLKNSDKVRGGDFLSITLDSPALKQPVNLSAFPPDEKGREWRIVWQRPRQMAQAAA